MIDPTREKLLSLEPRTAQLAFAMVVAARQAGIPLIVISGKRTAEENRAVGGAPSSWHLFGKAFDVAVVGYTRDEIPFWWWEMLGSWAEANLGLSWGGRFVSNGEVDVNHFDVRGMFV